MPKGVYVRTDKIRKSLALAARKRKPLKITWGDKISAALKGRTRPKKHLGCKVEACDRKHRASGFCNRHYLQILRYGEISKGKRSISKEHKAKLSAACKGRIVSLETRKKIREANLGKKRPGQTGENNPMHTHPSAYKSKWGKVGFRKDLNIFVRSTWEANMMRIFNYLGLIVEYEPQSFKFSDGSSYRPDFYILDTDEIIEIKGFCREKDMIRIDKFRTEYPGIPFKLIDKQKYVEYFEEFNALIQSWEGGV